MLWAGLEEAPLGCIGDRETSLGPGFIRHFIADFPPCRHSGQEVSPAGRPPLTGEGYQKEKGGIVTDHNPPKILVGTRGFEPLTPTASM